MSSLYEMIYSQQSEPQSDTEAAYSPNPRTKKRQKTEPAAGASTPAANAVSLPLSSSQDDMDALDRYYGIPTVPTSDVAVAFAARPETIISNGIERRKRKRPGRKKRSSKHSHHPNDLNDYDDDNAVNDDDDLWETESQAMDRIQRNARKRTYRQIQARWKRRKRSVQTEVDHGSAVQHMARKVMGRRKRNGGGNKQGELATAEASYDSGDDDQTKPSASQRLQQHEAMTMDSSDEEQREALGSLWTSMTPQDDSSVQEKDAQAADPHDDYSQWDYFQLGYDAPRKEDLHDFYYYNYARDRKGGTDPFHVNLKARAKRLKEMEAVTCTPVRLYAKKTEAEQERYYLDMEMPTTCLTHSSFHHASALRTMALQCLVSTSAGKPDVARLENRLLRNLYSAPTQGVARSNHVETQAMERGCEFVLFHSHKWKRRKVVARALGMTSHSSTAIAMTGGGGLARHGIGYSLEREAIQKNEGPEFRKKLVRLLSDGRIPYRPQALGSTEQATTEIGEDKIGVAENGEGKTTVHDEQVSDEMDTQSNTRQETEAVDSSPETARIKLEIDGKPDPDAASFRTYMDSDIDYVHKAGTRPPVPSFPLDESQVLLGGEDRYSRVHRTAKIDDATYTVTVSVLLARLGQARLDKDRWAIQDIQKQIMTYVDEVAQDNVVQLHKFSFMRRKRREQPSAIYYRAMMGTCSFVANSGCSFDDPDPAVDMSAFRRAALGHDWMHGDSDLDDAASKASSESVNMKAVAQTIYNNCAECPTSPALTIFPRIHVTTALALIAKHLPPSAAEMLARPLDDLSFRTPFDVMKKTLEFLEENNVLTDSHLAHADGDVISAGYLEHIVHQATSIFRRAAERNPDDLLCQAWYISGLASSLLLCSGNAIDSRAYLLPSSRKETDEYDMIFSSPDEAPRRRHEVRQKMTKFPDLRRDVSRAIKNLLRLAHGQASSTGNLVASSVLEWSQVIALLIGPRSIIQDDDSVWSDIRRLHSHFAADWAIRENSEAASLWMEEMVRHRNVSAGNVLELLASAVENNPSDVHSWRRLVLALGPFGCKVSSRHCRMCKKNNCSDCKRLLKGLNVDHAVAMERKDDAGWWGEGRASWWDEHIIALEVESAEKFTSKDIFCVSESIERKLMQKGPPVLFHGTIRDLAGAHSRGTSISCDDHISWLRDAAISIDGSEVHGDDQKEHVNHLLPSPFARVSQQGRSHTNDLPTSLVFGPNGDDPSLEIHCCKIVIACHLYGVSHRIVGDGVWYLALECWNGGVNTARKEWQCLAWLSSMGLNIPQILYDLYTICAARICTRTRSSASYSSEEKEAIRLGTEIFGTERWAKIRDFFSVFQHSSRRHVKNVYTAMKANGEL